MIMEKRSFFTFRKGDFAAIALVAILAIAVFAAYLPGRKTSENAVVQIYHDGALVREASLDTDEQIEISGEYVNVIAIRGGSAFIEKSDCPGMDCVHSGKISSPGRSIVCLPNRVEIRITGESEVDFVVGNQGI